MPTGQYTQLGPVRTRYDERGEGDALVLMHGGLVDAQSSRRTSVRWPSGSACSRRHGGDMDTPDVEEPITYQLMTDDTIALLEQVVGEPADLVGHSDRTW